MAAPPEAGRPGRRLRRLTPWIILAILLAQMLAAMLASTAGDAPTVDEQVHIGAGAAYVTMHDLRWNPSHPPLVKALAGIPLRASGVTVPQSGPALALENEVLGRAILYQTGNDPDVVLRLARLPNTILSLLFVLVAFGFARDLFGIAGGLVSAAVLSLCPNLLAHGRLVTTDVPVAGFLLLATWLLWRAVYRNPAWLLGAGAAYGLALASKHTALLLAPVLVILACLGPTTLPRASARARRVGLAAARASTFLALALAVLWSTYLAVDPRLRFDRTVPAAERAHGVAAAIAGRLPVPEPYRVGLRFQLAANSSDRNTFLLGHFYRGSNPAYYPTLLLLKTPIGTLLLWGVAGIAIARSPGRRQATTFLLFPAGVFLAIAMASNTNIGLRHVLPTILFLGVASGAVVHLAVPKRTAVVAALLAATAASAWRTFPSYPAYVNEAFGGPSRAHRLVSDSNIDWGQDLKRLAHYLEVHRTGEPVWLLYFGGGVPPAYGIDARNVLAASPGDVHGLVAASVTALNSYYGDRFDYIREGRLVGQVGYSILLYELP